VVSELKAVEPGGTPPADREHRDADRVGLWIGASIVIMVLALMALVVVRYAAGSAATVGGVLVGMAGVLGALPSIIRALRGR
jgi:hypothetical protein